MDFRRAGNRYAETIGNQLVYVNGKDSTKIHLIKEFRVLHIFEKAPTTIMVLSGIIVFLAIIGYLISGIKIG